MKNVFAGFLGFVGVGVIPEFNLVTAVQVFLQVAIAIITIYKLLKKPNSNK
jgi:hypothetical protein